MSGSKVDSSSGQSGKKFRIWLQWLAQGSLAIADQGLFALSNFLLNVLLVRWLMPAEYGVFALAYSVFLLLLIVHNALVSVPMLVFGQGKYRENFSEYLGILLRGHIALMLIGSALLAAAAFLLREIYSAEVELGFLALAAAAPFILLLWLLRRACYARLDPAWAAASGIVYFVILVAGTVALHAAGVLSPAGGFLNMGTASLVTSTLLMVRLRPVFATNSTSVRAVVADHWNYGKWVAAGAGPNWITDNIYFIVLPARLGLAEAGAFKALLNLAQPASQCISALGVLLMPILVHGREAGGDGGVMRILKFSLVLFTSCSIAYLALLWWLRFHIFHLLYGGRFSAYDSWPVLIAGLLPIAQSLSNIAGAGVGAIERPKLGFWADAWSAACALALGVPLTLWLRAGGALVGTVISYTLMGILTLWFLMRSMRQDARTSQPLQAGRRAHSHPTGAA